LQTLTLGHGSRVHEDEHIATPKAHSRLTRRTSEKIRETYYMQAEHWCHLQIPFFA